jgi:hypothetical protein
MCDHASKPALVTNMICSRVFGNMDGNQQVKIPKLSYGIALQGERPPNIDLETKCKRGLL